MYCGLFYQPLKLSIQCIKILMTSKVPTPSENQLRAERGKFLDPNKLLSLSGPMSDPRQQTMDSEKRKIKNFDHILQFAKSV